MPASDARDRLRGWLRAHDLGQAGLASAIGVSQQTISEVLDVRLHRLPSDRIRVLIELATGGYVKSAAWLSTDEREEQRRTETRARGFARRHSRKPRAAQRSRKADQSTSAKRSSGGAR